jgi:hypothetical protein
MNISENKNRLDPVVPDEYACQLGKYENVKGVTYSDGELRYDKYPPIKIHPRLYQKMTDNIIDPLPNETDSDTLIWCILFRYKYCELDNNVQLAVLKHRYENFQRENGACLEMFGSAMNHTLPHFCSLFYDLEKYYGSKGNFYNLKIKRGFFLLNPPFAEPTLSYSLRSVMKSMEKYKDIKVYITIPIWDYRGIDWVNCNCKLKRTDKDDYDDLPVVKELIDSPFQKLHKRYCKEDYQYFSYLMYKKINAVATQIFLLVS